MLKISRANLAGVFKENSGPALSQYDVFPIHFVYVLSYRFWKGDGVGGI